MECKNRSSYWDNIKGILILLVVFGHVLLKFMSAPTIRLAVVAIYVFHMPAFAFVSGYFGKSKRSSSFASLARLAMLYLLFNGAWWLVVRPDSLLEPLDSFWYLLALLVWRATAERLSRIPHIDAILLGMALFAGFFPSIDNTLAIGRTICFYPFYMAGYRLTQERAEKIARQPAGVRCGRAAVSLAAAAAAAYVAGCLLPSFDSLMMAAYVHWREVWGRAVLFAAAGLMIWFLLCAVSERQVPLLTMLGRNSLWIYLFHRPFVYLTNGCMPVASPAALLLAGAGYTLLMVLLFGNDSFARLLNAFADACGKLIAEPGQKVRGTPLARAAVLVLAAGYVAYAALPLLRPGEAASESAETPLPPVMTAGQQQAFDGAIRLTFAGDLILLEDQVKRGYAGGGYDFDPVFAYARRYIGSADYAIGVLEGPLAGAEAGYSTGNFDDGKELYLNFPDAFAEAIQRAGFDLVATANNHVLDKGPQGAARTLDVLDALGLAHTGSYRDMAEKKRERVKLIEVGGVRIAVLAYTYGSNNYTTEQLTGGELAYVTSVLCGAGSADAAAMRAAVGEDFAQAKALDPDLILVLPHMGTQFSNEPDAEQTAWFRLFKELGADIILGDHPHAVQPVQMETFNGRTVFTAYCPGNFVNCYRAQQGDTSMLVNVYIDRQSKEIIGGSVVPLYTQSAINGNYRAIPIYDIVNDADLRAAMSTDDLDRAALAHETVTQVVFGQAMNIDGVSEQYYFDQTGFLRSPVTGLALTAAERSGTLYRALAQAESVCFVGDSVTEGTKNGGCPWYEPLLAHFKNTPVSAFAKGGCTVSYMVEHVDDIPKAGLYVIALGVNDVRYRDASACAMTAQAYVEQIDALRAGLTAKVPGAAFVFLAPWYSLDGDPYTALSYSEKMDLTAQYGAALREYCQSAGVGFADPNPYIAAALDQAATGHYLLDHIHPNAGAGVRLYARAALLG